MRHVRANSQTSEPTISSPDRGSMPLKLDQSAEFTHEKFARHKVMNKTPQYGMLQAKNRLPYGWSAQTAVNVSASLPKVHRNYEKFTLNEIDKKHSQMFLQ